MSSSPNITYPAMGQLISRMTDNDLLVLSGFIIALYEEADAIVLAIEALPKQMTNSPGEGAQAIKHSAETFLSKISIVSSRIMEQLVENRKKIASDEYPK